MRKTTVNQNKKQWMPLAALTVGTEAALWQGLAIRRYAELTEKLAVPLRLLVLSDLHSAIYGKKQAPLVKAIGRQKPDVILMAGDIADDKAPHSGTLQLLSQIGWRYPSFYVAGNHEFRSGEAGKIKQMICRCGVTVLAGNMKTIRVRGQQLRIGGVDDPTRFRTRRNPFRVDEREPALGWRRQFAAVCAECNEDGYSVLISHRPELVRLYEKSGFDLVVAGHAHGGQVRIPGLLNGLYAPEQGMFPQYAGGRYRLGETNLIVSRGLCRNSWPRIFNPPELVVIDLLPAGAASPARKEK